jgi:hypothetical protein
MKKWKGRGGGRSLHESNNPEFEQWEQQRTSVSTGSVPTETRNGHQRNTRQASPAETCVRLTVEYVQM